LDVLLLLLEEKLENEAEKLLKGEIGDETAEDGLEEGPSRLLELEVDEAAAKYSLKEDERELLELWRLELKELEGCWLEVWEPEVCEVEGCWLDVWDLDVWELDVWELELWELELRELEVWKLELWELELWEEALDCVDVWRMELVWVDFVRLPRLLDCPVLDCLETELEDETEMIGAHWYMFKRTGPPQYSFGFALHIISHPLTAGVVLSSGTEPALITSPQ
jgi:hypothetical protein